MDEVKTGNLSSSSSRVSSSYIKAGNRQLFSVELRPGETTIVSWKKLLKDANKAASGSTSVPVPFTSPPAPAPAPDLGVAPAAEPEAENAAAPNRFSAVIEKIERLYMGKDSSDEEDRGDIPDDDQYDTEDSFIDDAELDEYFEVDNAATKHDGFFVNRGKLEYLNDPAALPNQQPKKRRRKDSEKGNNEKAEVLQRNKHVKVGKSSEKAAVMVGKNSSNLSGSLTSSEPYQDTRYQDERKIQLDYALVNYGNADSTISLVETKSAEKQKTVQKNLTNKFKDPSGSAEKGGIASLKSPAGRSLNNANEMEVSHGPRERNTIREVPDLNMPDGKHAVETSKASNPHRKDGAGIRPKSSMLEKAIRELEKLVAESRPPATENHEADISSQAVKRRLPSEVKLKLAKVARLASSHGKISKELINRLMSIVGHLIQVRTLKRNLKIMVSMGLSAKQEKESRFQQIKKEVADMVNMRVSPLDTKALEQRAMTSNDFQEYSSEEKGLQKRKFDMDAAMEDKICALYDLYVDGLDEDTGPQVRKLYSELAALWPSGLMDNHGIKRAICRAKERQRAMYSKYKDQEKITKKKMLTPKVEDAVQTEGGLTSLAQLQHSRDRLTGDSTNQHSSVPMNKSSTCVVAAVQVPSPTNPTLDMVKQEKGKGSSGQLADDPRLGDDALPKKKTKKKPEVDLNVMPCNQEKLPSQQGDEQPQSTQYAGGLPNKLSLQSTSATSFGHLS